MKSQNKEKVPLLPDRDLSSDTSSISGAVYNVSTSMIGAGIMSIPATLKVLGIIPGFVIILLMAYLVEVTVDFLLKYTRSGQSATYGGLMAESFGKSGAIALQICVIVSNLGALIIYLIITGDVLSGSQAEGKLHLGILQEWFGIHWWNSRPVALLLIVLFVMLPLLLLRRIESLRHASAISILLAVVFIVISSAMAIHALWEGKSQKLRLFPDFSSGVSYFDLFTTVPVLTTALACHVTIHPVQSELSRPSDMSSAVRYALLLTVVIYFAVGFIGYLLFGEAIMADILVNFDQNSDSPIGLVVNDLVRISYAAHLLLVFPVIHYSLRVNVDELLFPNKVLLANDNTRFTCLTLVQLAVVYLAAIAIPDIWLFFQFMGSTTVACLAFVFPGALVLRNVHGISTRTNRIMAVVVILLAVATSIIAISTNLYSFVVKT